MPSATALRHHRHVLPSEAPGPEARGAPAVPDLSIVIVNRNTRALLEACLASIRSSPETPGLEVIVVDNGSTDGSPEMVRTSFPEVRLIANAENTGYAFPNNQGIAASRGRYVLLLNSDTEVRPSALGRMVEFMDSHPEAGACGPLLRFPDGRLQRSCYSVPSPRTFVSTMLTLDRRFPRSRLFGNQHTGFGHDRTAEVEAVLGAALLVRREALERVGGLDERLRIHYNDFDWCLRIREEGWKLFFVHDAEVVHHLQATTRAENRHLELQPELVRNLFEYFRKHYGAAGVRWVRIAMLVGWGGRWLAFGALDRLRGRRGDPAASRQRLGLARAALSGRPERSGSATNTSDGEAGE
ncbi:MAG TPA: glycosyltransferase family 2 protein [Longimicrobiaceae bacterium]|nr:glycosyltransferase family 2 protein [Longimicrobiaceae bacterium]